MTIYTSPLNSLYRSSRYIRVGALRDATRFLKSDWFALYAANGCIALYQAFSFREKAWLCEARGLRIHSGAWVHWGGPKRCRVNSGFWCARRGRRVHSCSRRITPAQLGVVWFREDSLERSYGSSGLFGFALVHSGAPSGRRVHTGSRRFTSTHVAVVRFIRYCECSLGRD